MDRSFEDVKLVRKVNWNSFRGWHKVVGIFFAIIGLWNKAQHQAFYERYWNVIGRTIYVPEAAWEAVAKTDSHEAPLSDMSHPTIQHELIHMVQKQRERGWLGFERRYLGLVFHSALSARYRFAYEYEAYMTTMLNVCLLRALDESRQDYALPESLARTMLNPIYRMAWRSSQPEDMLPNLVAEFSMAENEIKGWLAKMSYEELVELRVLSMEKPLVVHDLSSMFSNSVAHKSNHFTGRLIMDYHFPHATGVTVEQSILLMALTLPLSYLRAHGYL